ncbi:hypothetical protein, partial [Caldibacillus thermoamylovorans]|uniref:hypothetical protein n=1 Tax=Caldibacillus thermoamylovorans TaxID=35841 RepID=UPI0005583AC7
ARRLAGRPRKANKFRTHQHSCYLYTDILRQFQNSLTEPRKQASKVAESVQKECLGIPDI